MSLGKVFIAPNGSLVYVGRNSKENDKLTFEFAKSGDLWFHVADVAGSHVVMKKGDSDFSMGDIVYAASLAKHHSKAKNVNGKAKINVSYCDVLCVMKEKHAPSGQVRLLGEIKQITVQ